MTERSFHGDTHLQTSSECCIECGRPMDIAAKNGISFQGWTMIYHGQRVKLNLTQLKLARVLARVFGQIVHFDILMQRVWGDESDAGVNNLHVQASHLRKRLATIGLAIKTEWGVGYKLVTSVEKRENYGSAIGSN